MGSSDTLRCHRAQTRHGQRACFFEDWDEEKLREILAAHIKIIELLKQRHGVKQLPSIAVIIDDFADSPEVTHNPRHVITSLFVRGRHAMVSTFASTQTLRAISTLVRVNSTCYLAFHMHNPQEYEHIAEELSALVGKPLFRDIYNAATREPFSFLTIKANAKQLNETFRVRFEQYIQVEDDAPPP